MVVCGFSFRIADGGSFRDMSRDRQLGGVAKELPLLAFVESFF